MFEDPKRRIPLREVVKIPLLYLAMGFFWIYFSDRLVSGLITDLEVLRIVNTYKGWVYVLVTGMILYFLIARQVEKLREREREILRSESKYRTLIQQMQLGMALYEGKPDSPVDQYVLQEVNDSHGVLMGLEGKDILGKPLGAIFPAMKEENRMKLQDTANSGDPVRFDSF